jgi:hypothetical protein
MRSRRRPLRLVYVVAFLFAASAFAACGGSGAGGGSGSAGTSATGGLPASSGKAFVDKLWSTAVPNRNYWDGVLYFLALLHVSGTFHLYY